jgi:hypothetical protein
MIIEHAVLLKCFLGARGASKILVYTIVLCTLDASRACGRMSGRLVLSTVTHDTLVPAMHIIFTSEHKKIMYSRTTITLLSNLGRANSS